MKNFLITPSLTSLNQTKMSDRHYLDVRLNELQRLKLKEISLFLTTVKEREREYIKQRLLQTSVVSIPHVHLRDDMQEREAWYYYDNYKTRYFTIHQKFRKNFIKWSPKIRKCIGIENNYDLLSLDDIEKFGGLVIDVSHFVMHKVHYPKLFKLTEQALKLFPVITNHASGVLYEKMSDIHWIHHPSNYYYINEVPKKCWSKIISLEIGNSFSSQQRYVNYLTKLIQPI